MAKNNLENESNEEHKNQVVVPDYRPLLTANFSELGQEAHVLADEFIVLLIHTRQSCRKILRLRCGLAAG